MAKVCSTPRCPAIIPADAYKGRCTKCNREADQARGSREARGYGADHLALRTGIQQRLDAGEPMDCTNPDCLTPDLPIEPKSWQLGHDGQRRHRGPEHVNCNLHTAGRAAHGL